MIIVTGAMGFVGRHLVAQLLRSGNLVRVLVPPTIVARYQRRHYPWPWAEAGEAEIFPGSIFQAESLFQAMQGVHTVYHLASAQWWGSRHDLEQIDLIGTRQIIAGARAARVGRIITLSHLGAEPSSAYPLLRVKGQVEELIRSSGVAYTIFRCGVVFGPDDHFVNNLAMLVRANPIFFFQPGHGEHLLNPLYIHNLVAALEASLESLGLVDVTVDIGGGEYVSFNEMTRTVMRVTHAKRVIFPLPPYFLRWLTGVANVIFPRWPATKQWFDLMAGHRTARLGNLYEYTGVRPVRFEDTLVTYMPQRRYSLELLRFMFRRRPGIRF
ncbi:MAG: NAD(P)H-binding protein [Anaerolineae bacterium]|nr:NAD(P)H-binding protein [Anaerolineae bacterium]